MRTETYKAGDFVPDHVERRQNVRPQFGVDVMVTFQADGSCEIRPINQLEEYQSILFVDTKSDCQSISPSIIEGMPTNMVLWSLEEEQKGITAAECNARLFLEKYRRHAEETVAHYEANHRCSCD